MAGRGLEQVVRFLNRTAAVQQNGKLGDAELLERFIRAGDSAAFEVLVWRYGSMVLKVCRRISRSEQDAEDGFQATFMTLARKAQTIGRRCSISSWLYKVAFRASLESQRRVPQSELEPWALRSKSAGPVEDAIGGELHRVLDEEILHLAEKYRAPLLLSSFQGKSNQEIASQLRCPEATVRTRLARAHERLRARLGRRGVHVTTSVLASALCLTEGQTVSAALIASATDLALGSSAAAAGFQSAAWIAKRVQYLMLIQTIKQGASAVALVAGLICLTAVTAHQVVAAKSGAAHPQEVVKQIEKKPAASLGDQKAIIGTWETSTTATQVTTNPGRPPISERVQVKVRWVIDANKIYMVGEDGFIDEEYDYTLDSSKHPKAIDLVSQRSGRFPSIYELDGNTLKVSMGSRNQRPANFLISPDREFPIFQRISSEPAKVSQRYPNAPGCFWLVSPTGAGGLMATLGITFLNEEDKDGAAVVILAAASSLTRAKRLGDYRPVLFDSEKRRFVPTAGTGGSSASPEGAFVSLQSWRMDPKILPKSKVAKIGIECVTMDATRLMALDAMERAEKVGIEILLWPQIDTEYPLELTTIEGRKLGQDDFEDKVIVVACWASWCAPCIANMPALKRMYEKWHKDGLEIVGVSLDQDIKALRNVCKAQGLPWPQVQAPTDEKAREIWQQAGGIASVPRYLLIDRKGILRSDTPKDLEAEIGKLLKEPKQPE